MAADHDIVPATARHAAELAPEMRAEDAFECQLVGQTPLEAAEYSVASSGRDAWAWTVGGRTAALFGVSPHPAVPAAGVVWLLTSGLVPRHPVTFARAARRALPMLLERYPVLVNAIPARCQVALRWARRAGFQVLAAHDYQGEPVHDIVLTEEDLPCAAQRG